MMPESDFIAAGYSDFFYSNLKYVVEDEESHVVALTAGIKAAGGSPVAACTYDFPFVDVKSFVTLASVLEGVGVSAYLGAAGSITDKDYLTIAASILVTEAIHTSLLRFNIGEIAPANPYGSPLGLNEVFTLAGSFIVSCPASNGALPVSAFPTLTPAQGIPTMVGIPFDFTFTGAAPATPFITYVNGLSVISEPATVKGTTYTAQVPQGISGQSYAILTSSNVTGTLTDSVVVAGPAIVEVTPSAPTFDLSIL